MGRLVSELRWPCDPSPRVSLRLDGNTVPRLPALLRRETLVLSFAGAQELHPEHTDQVARGSSEERGKCVGGNRPGAGFEAGPRYTQTSTLITQQLRQRGS